VDADIADRIAFVNDGRVTATGDPDDLLEDVPPVVRMVGAGPETDAVESHVVADRLFYHGDELRGFLAADATRTAVETALDDDATVETVEPSYTDAFNYYVHARPDDE
jgi:ABC-2 type transport system ATP-binding protein